jgi:2-aminoadipate transaminase
MNWENHFAARTQRFRRNTVREFLRLAGQPGIISFAGGMPDSNMLPVEEMKVACERALRRIGAKALQYGPSEGIPELRHLIAERCICAGVTAENVLITTGSQQALDLIGRVLVDDGATVAVQNPTYLAALSAWAPLGAKFRTLDDSSASKTSMAYVIPNFRNPTGDTMDRAARQELVQHCEAGRIPILEDDAYGELRFEGEPVPSLLEIAGTLSGPVIHVGTFSKILAPGLRLGWIIASTELIAKLVQARQAADLHTSTFTQYTALQAVEDGILDYLLPRLRAAYRQKRDAMLQALSITMSEDVTWSRPEGGLFIMLRLPAGTSGRALAARSLESGVLVVPGEEFHIEGGTETVRLNFSHPSLAQISRGISLLAESIRTGSLEERCAR